jgi:cob(I)alamin adenosyltransferase
VVFKIYTKTGDQGQTALLGGLRVPKDNLRVEAYGDVDELNACLGWVLAQDLGEDLKAWITQIQSHLFELGTHLASSEKDKKWSQGVGLDDIAWVEKCIDQMEADLAPLKTFIMPAGHPACAALHVARTVCRRAERRTVTLERQHSDLPAEILTFLNRLSDFLFVAARFANHLHKHADVPWEPRQRP